MRAQPQTIEQRVGHRLASVIIANEKLAMANEGLVAAMNALRAENEALKGEIERLKADGPELPLNGAANGHAVNGAAQPDGGSS